MAAEHSWFSDYWKKYLEVKKLIFVTNRHLYLCSAGSYHHPQADLSSSQVEFLENLFLQPAEQGEKTINDTKN